jgi:hypothetical protein
LHSTERNDKNVVARRNGGLAVNDARGGLVGKRLFRGWTCGWRWGLGLLAVILTSIGPAGVAPVAGAVQVKHSATSAAGSISVVGQLGGSVTSVAVQGTYAYIGLGARVAVIDVSNIGSPHLVGQSSLLPGVVGGIAVSGSHA